MMVIYHDFRRYFHIVLHRNESSFIVSLAYMYIFFKNISILNCTLHIVKYV